VGNLAENERSFLFLMDYSTARRRLKLWGRARVTDEPPLLARLADPAYSARVERAIVFTVLAWDWNRSQHVPKWCRPSGRDDSCGA
jgi:predicted pyridoxine 5'-phosphate oxidase superfamily flavin-nucleotide-binding protein